MKKTVGLICCVAALGVSCSKDKKSDENKLDEQPQTQQTTTAPHTTQTIATGETTPIAADGSTDLALVGEDVTTQVEDAIDAIMSEDASSLVSFGLKLVEEEPSPSPSPSPAAKPKNIQERTCAVETNSAGAKETKISISSDLSYSRSFELNKISRSVSVVNKSLLTRIWSKPNAEIPCDKNKTHIVLALEDRKGVTMNGSFEDEASSKSELKRDEKITKIENSKKAKGNRKIEFTDVVTTDTTFTVKKNVSYALEKTFTRLNKKGETTTSTINVATAEASPIVFETIHDKTSRHWKEQKIASGKTVATYKSGDRLELTYKDVVYKHTKGCEGNSGTITGSYFKSTDLANPAKTFTINLADEIKEITFGDGQKQLFAISGCSFEEVAQPMVNWNVNIKMPPFNQFLQKK